MARQTEAQKKADEAKAKESVEVKGQNVNQGVQDAPLTDSAMDDQLKALEEGQPINVTNEPPDETKDEHKVVSMSSSSVKQTLENPFYFMNMGQLRRYAKAIGVRRVRDVGRFGLIHKIVAQAKKKKINMLRISAAKDAELKKTAKIERAALPGETSMNPKNVKMSHAMSEEEYRQARELALKAEIAREEAQALEKEERALAESEREAARAREEEELALKAEAELEAAAKAQGKEPSEEGK